MIDSSFYWDNLLSSTFEMATFLKWYWEVQKILEFIHSRGFYEISQ